MLAEESDKAIIKFSKKKLKKRIIFLNMWMQNKILEKGNTLPYGC